MVKEVKIQINKLKMINAKTRVCLWYSRSKEEENTNPKLNKVSKAFIIDILRMRPLQAEGAG